MIYVRYLPNGGRPELLQIQEKTAADGELDRAHPFAVLEAVRQRIHPGVAVDPAWKHPNARPLPSAAHERAGK